ncbi:MAG: carboxypeptidase-like regulatory domain-containing protein, partial [Acidobacteriota bacterium]
PLSPVTLLLPYYARAPYFSDAFLDARLGELGIGYSLATAPLNKQTAKFPRVITTDVFTRAIDLARAGERMFIGEDRRDSLANLAVDALGNSNPLAEWDQFRRQEIEEPGGDIARVSSQALGDELSAAYATPDGTFAGLADRFASATSFRAPYTMVLVRGPKTATARPNAVRLATSGSRVLDVPSSESTGWKRQIPYGDSLSLQGTSESAELALIGRATDPLDVTIASAAAGASTLDLVFPSADGTTLQHATATFTGGSNASFHVHVENGVASSSDLGLAVVPVPVAKAAIVGARQDLHLDPDGHVVSLLFNRSLPAVGDLSAAFTTDVTLDSARFGVAYSGTRPVAGATLQQDGRIIRVNYDAALSDDVSYLVHTTGLVDPANPPTVTPVIEHRSSALLIGSVLSGTNAPLPGADLTLQTGTGIQWQKSDASGRFLFEYVPRDPDNSIDGRYAINAVAQGKSTHLEGTVRLLHTVHQVNVTFLGRGSARGHVRYDNGDPVANASVVVGSTMFSQFRRATTDAAGFFSVDDVPVGPLTFSAQDQAGNVAYAANELRAGGAVVTQDVSIFRRPFPGMGTVRGRIVRNDTNAPVAGAHVGVYSQGYGLRDTTVGADGLFEFTKVPAGFVTVLAEDYQVAPQSLAVDFDLKADAVHDTGDLALNVRTGEVFVAVEGDVTIENPLQAGDFHAVPGAQVQIDGMPVITADSLGHYAYTSVPLSFSGTRIRAYDTATRRVGTSFLHTLSATAVNREPIVISNASGSGVGTARVHLLSAAGAAVIGYHVFEPGFPNLDAVEKSDGVYEFANISVGRVLAIVAAPAGGTDATYGYQFAQASASVAFAGKIAAVSLRLPGQGTVRGRIVQQTEAGVQVQVAGKLHVSFTVWGDVDRNPVGRALETPTDGANDAIFARVPASQNIALETFESVGYAATSLRLNFDGDSQTRTLLLSTLASVRGRVLAPDGYTPVAGAAVRLIDGSQDFGQQPTALDGSFEFRNVAPGSSWTATAEWTQNAIFRTARASGSTPSTGGPVNNVTLILLSQGSVDGKVVNA